ncbi:UNVERIFIED_CONTAM: hypothetical protein B566_EDAN017576 [Ephemera danica]|nr:hypothetical protein B566_EDAN017576 [Ephemera danica]
MSPMNKLFPLLAFSLLALPAAADPLTAAVAEVGRINGVALACQQPALVSRARNAILTSAPKTRAYGEAFEDATSHGQAIGQRRGQAPGSRPSCALRLLLAAFLSILLGTPTVTLAQPPFSAERSAGLVPRYLLQDPHGRSVTSEDFRGRFQLIAFGYTYCPDICPTTLVEMAAILKGLGDQAKRLQPIFITVDPERDTGEVLKTYTAFFDPRILGLTGTPLLVRRAADNFKIRYAKVREPGAENYAVDHSAGMILLGPDGQFIRKFAFAMPVDEILARLNALFGERAEARPRH